MKSKLLGICVTALVCTAWWTGCSSSSTGSDATADAGGGTDSGGTTDGGGTDASAQDAAKDTGVDAALTGPFIDITYGTCPSFMACGGDPRGTWNVTGGCVSSGLFAAAKQTCPGIVESNVKFQARGNVVADGTNISRHTEVKFTATLAVPSSCKTMNPLGATCAAAGQALVFGGLKTATCTDDAGTGGCNCDVADAIDDATSDTYTTAGNTLTTGTGSTARTFDYCATPTKLSYIETTARAVPVNFELAK